jgi:hypothetical protein
MKREQCNLFLITLSPGFWHFQNHRRNGHGMSIASRNLKVLDAQKFNMSCDLESESAFKNFLKHAKTTKSEHFES